RLVGHRPVEARIGDLLGAGLHACLVEHRLERHALPARVAHRAVAGLAAGEARLLPEHWLTATNSVDGRRLRSASLSFKGLSTLPLISTVQVSGSMSSNG